MTAGPDFGSPTGDQLVALRLVILLERGVEAAVVAKRRVDHLHPSGVLHPTAARRLREQALVIEGEELALVAP